MCVKHKHDIRNITDKAINNEGETMENNSNKLSVSLSGQFCAGSDVHNIVILCVGFIQREYAYYYSILRPCLTVVVCTASKNYSGTTKLSIEWLE